MSIEKFYDRASLALMGVAREVGYPAAAVETGVLLFAAPRFLRDKAAVSVAIWVARSIVAG
eukprot:9013450-Pyramimonas_sp.AAC.1